MIGRLLPSSSWRLDILPEIYSYHSFTKYLEIFASDDESNLQFVSIGLISLLSANSKLFASTCHLKRHFLLSCLRVVMSSCFLECHVKNKSNYNSYWMSWVCACTILSEVAGQTLSATTVKHYNLAISWQNRQMACAPSKDSNRAGHLPSLIRVFAVRMKKAWVLSHPLSAQRRLIWLGGCPGWCESSLGTQSFCWFCHEVAHIFIV